MYYHFGTKLAFVEMLRHLPTPEGFPDTAALAALHAWYEGASSRQAAERYLPDHLSNGKSARSVIARIRRQLARYARRRQRPDLAELFECKADQRIRNAKAIAHAVECLRTLPEPEPRIADDIARWLPKRAVCALYAADIRTLADLTVRIPRRRQWWTAIAGLGPAGARQIEAFFALHRALTQRARAPIAAASPSIVTPWEQLRLPHEVDASAGAFRAPAATCILGVDNDYDAILAWLALHESPATVDRIKSVTVATTKVSIGDPVASVSRQFLAGQGFAGCEEMCHQTTGVTPVQCAVQCPSQARSIALYVAQVGNSRPNGA